MPRSEFVNRNSSSFKKIEFIKLSPGKHIVRFLQHEKLVYDTHYVKGWTVVCPGEGCPVCANNTQLRMADPKNYYRNPSYISVRQVGVTNVLDKTPAKVCPKCGTEHKKVSTAFPTVCSKCNESLVTVQAAPLNKVKVMSKGRQVFEQIDGSDKAPGYKQTVLDEATQTPLDFTTYDFTIIVTNDSKATPVLDPSPEKNEPVSVTEDDFFDLEKAMIQLDLEEFGQLMRGVGMMDILRARSGSSGNRLGTTSTPIDYKNDIETLFSN